MMNFIQVNYILHRLFGRFFPFALILRQLEFSQYVNFYLNLAECRMYRRIKIFDQILRCAKSKNLPNAKLRQNLKISLHSNCLQYLSIISKEVINLIVYAKFYAGELHFAWILHAAELSPSSSDLFSSSSLPCGLLNNSEILNMDGPCYALYEVMRYERFILV